MFYKCAQSLNTGLYNDTKLLLRGKYPSSRNKQRNSILSLIITNKGKIWHTSQKMYLITIWSIGITRHGLDGDIFVKTSNLTKLTLYLVHILTHIASTGHICYIHSLAQIIFLFLSCEWPYSDGQVY